jgi:hypothetical protein
MAGHDCALPRRLAPGLCGRHSPKKEEGAGKRRVPAAPAARVQRDKHTVVTTGTPDTRHSLRNGFNGLFRALLGDEFVLSPSSVDQWRIEIRLEFASASTNLTPATGARTTRLCRTLQHRSSCARRSLTALSSPPCHSPLAPDAAASTASRPRVSDDHDTPPGWGGTGATYC